MSKLIEDWQSQKQNYQKQHKKLAKKLKTHRGKPLDRLATALDKEVFEQIDCLDCANCCTGLPPIVNKTDVSRIAKKIGLSVADFQVQYLTLDEDKDTVMKQSPCPFLLENRHCSIYEFRPKACREYPHTAERFSSNLAYHATNSLYCPATFHLLERLKNSIP